MSTSLENVTFGEPVFSAITVPFTAVHRGDPNAAIRGRIEELLSDKSIHPELIISIKHFYSKIRLS